MPLDVSLLTRPVTIERVTDDGPADEYGTPTERVITSTTTCEFQQRSRTEDETLAEIGQETWVAFFAPGTQLATFDRLIIDGLRYELIGPPNFVRHPRLESQSHIEATVRRSA